MLSDTGLGLSLIGSALAFATAYYLPNNLFIFVTCLMVVLLGCGLSMPVLSRLTLDASDAPMGIKITILSVIRMASGFIGSACLAWFYDGSLFSIAVIMIVFTVIAVALKRLAHIAQR